MAAARTLIGSQADGVVVGCALGGGERDDIVIVKESAGERDGDVVGGICGMLANVCRARTCVWYLATSMAEQQAPWRCIVAGSDSTVPRAREQKLLCCAARYANLVAVPWPGPGAATAVAVVVAEAPRRRSVVAPAAMVRSNVATPRRARHGWRRVGVVNG
jgi:hypothetical protein